MTMDDMTLFHQRLDKQDVVLSEIRTAIVGNPEMGHKGLVAQVNEHEIAIADHKNALLRWGGIVTGLGVVLGLMKDKIASVFH